MDEHHTPAFILLDEILWNKFWWQAKRYHNIVEQVSCYYYCYAMILKFALLQMNIQKLLVNKCFEVEIVNDESIILQNFVTEFVKTKRYFLMKKFVKYYSK
jgi:hypothetical protein